jgi:hypothetical protein
MKKWQQFESLVATIQSDLADQQAVVTPNDKILGKTGALRQVDVSIRTKVAQFELLIVIECKDYGRPLDVKDVEQFIGLVQDVGAHRAAMVSAKGYTSTARAKARMAQIDIYTVVDTGDHPWRRSISLPSVYQQSMITAMGIEQVLKSRYLADASIPPAEIEIFDVNGRSLGLLKNLIYAKWNAGEFESSSSREIGNISVVYNPVQVADYMGNLHEMEVYGNIVIQVRKYFGYLPLTEFSGLHNEETGQTIARRFVTSSVGRELENKWMEIQNLDDLAVRPILTFECSVAYGNIADEEERTFEV